MNHKQKRQKYKTGSICSGKQTIIYAWAMDAPELALPKGKTTLIIFFEIDLS